MRPVLWILALLSFVASASSWEKKAEARARLLIDKFGEGSAPALAKRLMVMHGQDQEVRRGWVESQGKPEEKQWADQMAATDTKLTAELKSIVERHGWPTFPLVGFRASNAAALILAHTADHEWQRTLLPELTKLAEQGKVDGSEVALITDKLLRADGKPQRFGTQFAIKDGVMTMDPVEDPTRLDDLRARFNLPPMKEYKKGLREVYRMKVR